MKNFTFSLKWHTILKNYPVEIRREVFDAVITYAATGKVIEMQPLALMAFDFIRYEIDERTKARERRAAKKASGKGSISSVPVQDPNPTANIETTEIPIDIAPTTAPKAPEPNKKPEPKIPDYLAARAEKQKPLSKTVALKGVKIKLVKPASNQRFRRKICA